MPYLNVDFDYFEHPKTMRLVNILGPGTDVLPLRLWSHCGKFHKKTGVIGRKSTAEMESLIDWWGDPGMAVRAMLRVGFLGRNRKGFFAHDWKDHQGHIWAMSERNRKASRKRWDKIKDELSTTEDAETNRAGITCEKELSTEPPVGTSRINKNTSGIPLSVPSVPSVEQQRTGVKSNTNLTALIASGPKLSREEALRQTRLLSIRMPFGRYEGVLLSDLPVEYCEWLQGNAAEHAKLGRDLREGLALRIALKAEECARG